MHSHVHVYVFACVCVYDQGTQVSVFEVTIRFLGGLLSSYALTKDEVGNERAWKLRALRYAFLP